MSTQHTPGPWELSEGDTSLWAKSPLGARVRISNIIKHLPINGINHAANARLIAAAPELLATLERLLSIANDGAVMRHETGKPAWSFIDEVKTQARAAITKATNPQA